MNFNLRSYNVKRAGEPLMDDPAGLVSLHSFSDITEGL